MSTSIRYGTHLPVLMSVINKTKGPVLELGIGFHSTPFLHFACLPANRKLVSYETDAGWAKNFNDFRSSIHDINHLDNWDKLNTNGFWDVILIDHAPNERRVTEVKRLSNSANYIILHDSDPEHDHVYKFSEAYPMFKYRFDYTQCKPNTTILSNFMDLEKFAV